MKVIIERQGRCIGGEVNMQVCLLAKRYHGQYQLTVKTGIHSFTKTLMKLNLRNMTNEQAKAKFYDVFSPLTELWEVDENASNDE